MTNLPAAAAAAAAVAVRQANTPVRWSNPLVFFSFRFAVALM